MRLVFDLETDNFLNSQRQSTASAFATSMIDQTWSYGPGEIDKGIELLSEAEMLVAHNGTGFRHLCDQEALP